MRHDETGAVNHLAGESMDDEEVGLNRVKVTGTHVGVDAEQSLLTVRFVVQAPGAPGEPNYAMTAPQVSHLVAQLQKQLEVIAPPRPPDR